MLGVAGPYLVTAGLAFLLSHAALPSRLRDTPLAVLLVVLVQVVGYLLAWANGASGAVARWMVVLLTTAAVVPVVALQAAVSRAPFVSLGRGSAASLLWLTLATCLVLLGMFVLVSAQSAARPVDAAIAFVPVAAAVPATLGARGDLGERSVLGALAVAMAVATVASVVGRLTSDAVRPLVGAGALALEFGLLWILGRGPQFGMGHGRIVPLTAAVLLTLTAAAAVFVPMGALIARRFASTVDAMLEHGPETREPGGIPPGPSAQRRLAAGRREPASPRTRSRSRSR